MALEVIWHVAMHLNQCPFEHFHRLCGGEESPPPQSFPVWYKENLVGCLVLNVSSPKQCHVELFHCFCGGAESPPRQIEFFHGRS